MSYEPHQRTPLSNFDDNSNRYILCCCHVRTWAWVIGIVEMVCLVLQFFGGIGNYARGGNAGAYGSMSLSGIIGGVVGGIIGIIVVALLMWGLKKIKPGFLIPHLVMQIISIILLILSAITYFVLAGLAGSNMKYIDVDKETGYTIYRSTVVGALVGFGFMMLIIAIVEAFFFWVILRAYRYLKDRAFANDAIGHVPMSTGGPREYSSTGPREYSSGEKSRIIS